MIYAVTPVQLSVAAQCGLLTPSKVQQPPVFVLPNMITNPVAK